MLIGIISKAGIEKSLDLASKIADKISIAHDVWVSDVDDIDTYRSKFKDTQLVITLGGDGTILRVARSISSFEIPILGINLGRVGFMTEIPYSDSLKILDEVLKDINKFRIEKRLMLKATGISNNQKFELNALNDIVLGHQSVSRLMDIDVYVDSELMAEYRADGIIISSEQKLMLIQPIAPHMSLDVGVVVPDDSKISINIASPNKAVVSADGFDEVVLGEKDKIDVEISKHVTRFIRLNNQSDFYKQLTSRLKRDVLKNE